jgi:hypothetical protein
LQVTGYMSIFITIIPCHVPDNTSFIFFIRIKIIDYL